MIRKKKIGNEDSERNSGFDPVDEMPSSDSVAIDDDSQFSIYYFHSFLLFLGRLLRIVLDFYNKIFDMNCHDKAKIYSNISTHYLNKGLHDKALQSLKEWTRLEPGNPEAHFKLGVALATVGKTKSAIGVFNKVLKLKPNHKGALYRKSSLLLKAKDYKGALECLQAAAEIVPDNPKVHYMLGIAYEGLEEIDKAIEAMQKAADLAPDEIRYHQHIGFLNIRKDDHNTAAKSFSKVMQLERELEEEEEVGDV